jgi:arginine-tRNA-protein transferase
MKTLAAAPVPDFDSYIGRPDTVYIEREGEPLELLYDRGFLPYSGTIGVQNVFYSARSARVVLQEFELSSENRRVARKFDGALSKERVPLADLAGDASFRAFVLDYFARRHGPRVMPAERLDIILASGLVKDVIVYRNESELVAYVLEVRDGNMVHFWYSAYDLSLTERSLGLWLMIDCMRDAKAAGLAHYYLGTVYGAKALYKTNFEPVEWWDGSVWQRDIAALKEKARAD